MKKSIIFAISALLVIAGCKNTDHKTTETTDNLEKTGAFTVSFADESILTNGKVDLAKLKPIVFDAAGMCYRALGEVVGQAWGSGKAFTE